MEAAIEARPDVTFQVKWRPFFLDRSLPIEGVNKLMHYNKKFGVDRVKQMMPHMKAVFAELGIAYNMDGNIGNTMDSHRLMVLAQEQGKQNEFAEAIFAAYFTQAQCPSDHAVLAAAATAAGVLGAPELLATPSARRDVVEEELQRFARGISGVPFFIIATEGKPPVKLSGGQPSEVFAEVFDDLIAPAN